MVHQIHKSSWNGIRMDWSFILEPLRNRSARQAADQRRTLLCLLVLLVPTFLVKGDRSDIRSVWRTKRRLILSFVCTSQCQRMPMPSRRCECRLCVWTPIHLIRWGVPCETWVRLSMHAFCWRALRRWSGDVNTASTYSHKARPLVSCIRRSLCCRLLPHSVHRWRHGQILRPASL